jgi:hypothetical protein
VTQVGLASALSSRVEVIVVVVSALIFELVGRKHLLERFAILWLVAGVTVLVLALWQGLLTKLSYAVGIHYPPAALFAVAFLFVLVMLVHFSMTVSRLSDQNAVLAQRPALKQQRLEQEQQGRTTARAAIGPTAAVTNRPAHEPSLTSRR